MSSRSRAKIRRSERRLDVSIYVSPASRTGYSVRLRGPVGVLGVPQ
jgi:hypothetical protein